MPIRESLKDRTIRERATLKGREFARVNLAHTNFIQKSRPGNFKFEIVELNPIDGGVELFVRAWDNKGRKIGFGIDGTVEIERFRVFNPPILVPDENGPIVLETVQELAPGEKFIRLFKYREDPQEALLQVIEHNLSVMQDLHGDKNIIEGKRGFTTSTFYASAGDGEAAKRADDWNTCVTAGSSGQKSGSAFHDYTSTVCTMYATNWPDGSQGNMFCGRTFFPFDTSALPDTDVISSAVLSLFLSAKQIASGAQTALHYGRLVSSNQASATVLAASDYGTVGSTALATADLNGNTQATGAYFDYTLNASGISNISKTGVSKFAVRNGYDLTNTQSTGVDYSHTRLEFRTSEYTGTTNDPKLVVQHAAGASPATFLAFMAA